MKRGIFSLFFIFSIIVIGCNEQLVETSEQLNNSYIVILNLNNINSVQSVVTKQDKIKHFLKKENINKSDVIFIYDAVITGFAARLSEEQIANLKKNKAVRYIEQDQKWSIKVRLANPNTTTPSQTTPYGITMIGGKGTPRSNIKVWILDTGIDLDHPDLNVNTSLSKTFIPTGTDSYSADDLNGHGSHVAGIVGARDNNIGVVGVAPGVELVAVKVLNQYGTGNSSWIIAGLDYIAKNSNSGDVVNISIGGSTSSSFDQAVYNCSVYNSKNIYIALAAGNNADNANNHSPSRIGLYYGNILTNNIVTVSAHDQNKKWAYFSNYGNAIEWCAPGLVIKSTYKDGKYASLSGTSMAAPHVTGIMAINGAPSNIIKNGNVSGDPDGTPDPLAHK